jgi:hypothetical protein
MFSACASAAISKTRRAGNCFRECQCVTADGVIPSIMANFLFPPSAAITLDISNSSTFQAPIKFYKSTDRKITKCKYYLLNYFMKFTKSSLLDKMDALGFNKIRALVKTDCGLPPCKHIRESVMHNTDIKVFQSSHQNPSANWVNKCVRMKAKRCKDASLFRRAENGIITTHLERGPPETIIGKFIDRARTATSSKPIPVNDGCLSSDSGGTDWKKREKRWHKAATN